MEDKTKEEMRIFMIIVSMEGQVGGGGGGIKYSELYDTDYYMGLALHMRLLVLNLVQVLVLVWVSPQIETGIEWCKGMRMPA